MSLINQVLKDLEHRRGEDASEAAITEDLCFKADTPPRRRRPGPLVLGLMSLAGIAMLSASGYGAWALWQDRHITTDSLAELPKAQAALPKQTAALAPLPENEPRPDPGLESAKDDVAAASNAAVPKSTAPSAPQAQKSVAQQPAEPLAKARSASRPASRAETATEPKQRQHQDVSHQQASSNEPRTAEVSDKSSSTVEKRRVPLRPEQRAEVAYQKAYQAMQSGRHGQAQVRLEEALAMDPGHSKARTLLAGHHIKNGRWAAANSILETGISIEPGNTLFKKLQARALMQMGRDAQAIRVLRHHAPPIGDEPDYHALLAALYQRTSQHPMAAETYMKVLKAHPQRGRWWTGLGISLEAIGRYEQAVEAYGAAQRSANLPDSVRRYVARRLQALEVMAGSAE